MSDEAPTLTGQFVELSQGLVFLLNLIPLVSMGGTCEDYGTPQGVVVVTQTCDAREDEFIQVAPVVELLGDDAKAAARGHLPRFVALPGVSENSFADLRVISTVHRQLLMGKNPIRGCASSQDANRFRAGVARKFGRAAIPDAVVAWLNPLRNLAKTKARKQGDIGWAFSQMDQIRIQLSNWESGPFKVHLWFVVDAGVLPTFPEDRMPEEPLELRSWIDDLASEDMVARIAKRLREGGSAVDRYFLWPAFGDALIRRCVSAGQSPEVVDCGSGVVMVNEFSLEQMKDTEQMDLAHLSDV